MIKNIVFDLGGVLINFNPPEYVKKLDLTFEQQERLKKDLFYSDVWKNFDRGTLSYAEGVDIVAKEDPDLKPALEFILLKDIYESYTAIEPNVRFMKELKSRGYNIYFLSNFNEEGFEYVVSHNDFFNVPDGMVISYQINAIKPEKKIYETLLKKYSLIPDETVFFDDTAVNIKAAEDMGIHGIQALSTEQMRSDMEELIKKTEIPEIYINKQSHPGKGKTVVVGMSGGVDSSVAAYLLKQQGYNVIGATMQIWKDTDTCTREREGGCCGLSAVEDARRVADKIGIPYYVMNFREEFQKKVIDYFVREYMAGRTPNPCIACNRYVKWESLLKRSMDIGADFIATGHYARIKKLPGGRYAVAESATAKKDQTYALYNLTQYQLSHTLMPVGDYTKPQVRKIAEEAGLPVAKKPDSMEICFVPDDDYAGFINRETGKEDVTGNFVDTDGNILGRHKGITHYTVGQRKHLGIAMGHPVFVREIRPASNEVVLGDAEDLLTCELTADNINYMGTDRFIPGERYMAKIRYSAPGVPCTVESCEDGKFRIRFDRSVRAVTPGQAAVLYKDDYIAGGGVICP